MGLLYLMGHSTPNTRSLFANNEAGLALDVGDRYGASESKRTWRRNLLTYSEQFDNAYWAKLNSTITANAATAPDGSSTAEKWFDSSTGTSERVLYAPTTPTLPAGSATTSIYAKASEKNWIYVRCDNGTSKGAWFDLTNGVVGTVESGASAAISSVGSGWYRCSVTATITAGQAYGAVQLTNADNVKSYTGVTNAGVFIWGIQLETGSTPTEYQPITDFSTEFKAAYPTHSLYQDSNGVTPAVSPGDPVGLILDTSKGGLDQLGSELVTNGGFDSDTSWNKGTGWAISGGKATFTGGTASYLDQLPGALTAGRFYRFAITVDSITSGNTIQIYLGASPTISTISAAGTYVYYAICQSPASSLGVAIRATSTNPAHTAVIDNISIKEIPGNHAYQTTSGSRPALARTPDGGRRNLLTYSEQFDNAAWTKMFSSVSANNSTAPDGTTTADLLVEDSSTNGRYLQQAITTTAQTYTFSVYLKMPSSNARRYALLYHNESVKGWVFDLQSGVVGAGGTTAVGAPAAYGIESVGSGWYRCYITITGTAASNQFRIYPVTNNGSGNASYTGDGVSGILVWGAQLETGSSATAYQKVGLTSDVTESGKRDCWGLLFDGSDDSLATSSVDFSATDKMTVMAGVRKSSDAVRGTIVEHGDSWQTVNGSFAIEAPAGTGANDYRLVSKGTSSNSQTLTTYAAPITNVITLQGNISAPSLIGRVNGTQVVSSTASQGTGNYTSQVILIGRRPSGPLQFNGILYTLIVRGATTPTGTIADFERNLLARRCGVTF